MIQSINAIEITEELIRNQAETALKTIQKFQELSYFSVHLTERNRGTFEWRNYRFISGRIKTIRIQLRRDRTRWNVMRKISWRTATIPLRL